jgi:hypothetical protein
MLKGRRGLPDLFSFEIQLSQMTVTLFNQKIGNTIQNGQLLVHANFQKPI